MLLSDKLEQFCDRRIRRSFLPVTSSRKRQSFEERLRFRNQFPQWTHPAFSPRLPHWGKKRIRLRPVPGQSAKSDRKATCFPVTLSQPISTIYYFAFVYRGMACHAAGCRFHPYSVKHSFRDYFWAEISSLFAVFSSQGWFPAIDFILICRFLLPGMIPSHRFHPDLLVSSHRDEFRP